MTLLDRFRAPARDTHPDPSVRLAFVQELPLDDRAALASFAREDPDARVRRAAVAKLMDPAALGEVARTDADADVRAAAVTMLRDIAVEAFEGVGEADSRAALDSLADGRTLVTIARTAPSETIALDALERIADAHGLGSVARHAAHETVRVRALQRLDDRAELLSVALNGDFKDTSTAAVDRFPDRADLEDIAERSKNKSAVKRARTLLREMDDRAALEAEAAARAAAEEAAQHAELARAAAADAVEAAARAQEESAVRARDDAARAAAEHAAAQAAEQSALDVAGRAAADEDARQQAERRAARLTELAAAAEAAAGQEDLAATRKPFALLRREWRDLAEGAALDPDLAARFAEADRRFAEREAAARDADQKTRRDALARVHQLLARIEPLAAREDLTLKAADRALRDLRMLLGQMPPLPSREDYDEVMKRLKAAQAALTPRVHELREVADWQRWANVGIQEQLCEKMEALSGGDDPEPLAAAIRDLQNQWRQAADVPRAQGALLWQRFKAAHDIAWAKCEAYFANQTEERSGHLAKKIALCERAEALADSTSWIQTADELKKLQAEWKTIGPVPRGQEKAVWDRFRTACDRFFTRRQADLSQRKTVWAENLQKKDALCVKAEALAESTDWEAAAAELRRLQAEWKTIGPVKKNRSEAIWQRFRGACDHFFTRYAHRHDIALGERVAAREAIVAELEALAPAEDAPASDPPADLLSTVRALRSRWQAELAARGVDRDRAVALEERFHAATARLVASYPAVFAGTDLDPDTNRKRMEMLVKRIEDLAHSLVSATPADDPNLSPTTRLAAMLKEALAANTIGGKADEDHRWRAAAEDVRQAQMAWSRIGHVAEPTRRPLADRFARACRAITDRASRAGAPARTGRA
ncbi:MAG TPA: DUF349 domain-containing protein [Vicinamibacterales bacterium]|jgi:hypothetical protein|nr:DUF349 domain-containing protein [Vicinamibacterales bacterium]